MSTMKDMFVEKAIKSGADKGIVDSITLDAPVVSAMPSQASTNGRENVYEDVISVDFAPQTELDAPLQDVNAKSKIGREGLLHLSAKQDVGVGKLNELQMGAPEYFASKAAPIFSRTMQAVEKTYIEKIRDISVANQNAGLGTEFGDRVHDAGGTTANSQYSISIVTFRPDEVMKLYNPTGFGGNGDMFDISQVGQGTRLNANNQEVYTYAYRMDTGFQIANPKYATSIVNIEKVPDMVTALQTDKIDYWLSLQLERAFAQDGRTMIIMHPELKVALGHAFSGAVGETDLRSESEVYNSVVTTWNGIPIVTSRNILNGTEPVQSV